MPTTTTTHAYAAASATALQAPHSIERCAPGSKDVAISIDFCGVCHSDLHFARGEWGPVPYPAVVGREVVGRVTAIGECSRAM